MAKNEDYLDGLLSSITDARKNSRGTQKKEEEAQKRKIAEQTSVSPDDDFLEAKGLSDYKPEPVSHSNLKRALSDDDFLKEFEEELDDSDEDDDDFIKDFEKELDDEDDDTADAADAQNAVTEESAENPARRENFDTTASSDTPAADADMDSDEDPSAPENLPEDAVTLPEEDQSPDASGKSTDVDSILRNAMREMDRKDAEDRQNTPEKHLDELSGNTDTDNSSPAAPEEASDDDFGSVPEEPDLSIMPDQDASEGNSDTEEPDLMSLLGADAGGDLSDIGDLLKADESDQTLPEAESEYNSSADRLSEQGMAADDAEQAPAPGKPSIFDKLKNLFHKKNKGGDRDGDVVKIGPEERPDLDAENRSILQEMAGETEEEEDPDDDGTAALLSFFKKAKENSREKKEQKKAAKEEKAKEKKEEKPKPKKEPKPKKPKKEDHSPVIPVPLIAINLVLALSIIAFVYIGTTTVSAQRTLRTAQSAYENQDYTEAFRILESIDHSDKDTQDLYDKSRILALMQSHIVRSYSLYEAKQYDMSLDELIKGYACWQKNQSTAETLLIGDLYNSYGSEILDDLTQRFSVDEATASELAAIPRKSEYTVRVHGITEGLGLVDGRTAPGADNAAAGTDGTEQNGAEQSSTDGTGQNGTDGTASDSTAAIGSAE